jgi:hypothetical protein
VSQGGLGNPKRRVEVRLQRRVEILSRDVGELGAGLLARGIVDQDVEPAEFTRGAIDQLATERLLADVSRNSDRRAARRADQPDDLLSVELLHRKVVDRHVRAFPGKGDGGGAPHP